MDSTGSLQTVQLGHADIHDYDLRLHLFSKSNRFASGLGLPTDLPARPRREKLFQPTADDIVIVYYQDSHGIYSNLEMAQELFLRRNMRSTIHYRRLLLRA